MNHLNKLGERAPENVRIFEQRQYLMEIGLIPTAEEIIRPPEMINSTREGADQRVTTSRREMSALVN
jgi:hypothetical protein